MKKTKKHRLVGEVVEILEAEGREINHNNIASWVMGQVNMGTHYGGKYGSIYPGDITTYLREFYHDNKTK